MHIKREKATASSVGWRNYLRNYLVRIKLFPLGRFIRNSINENILILNIKLVLSIKHTLFLSFQLFADLLSLWTRNSTNENILILNIKLVLSIKHTLFISFQLFADLLSLWTSLAALQTILKSRSR